MLDDTSSFDQVPTPGDLEELRGELAALEDEAQTIEPRMREALAGLDAVSFDSLAMRRERLPMLIGMTRMTVLRAEAAVLDDEVSLMRAALPELSANVESTRAEVDAVRLALEDAARRSHEAQGALQGQAAMLAAKVREADVKRHEVQRIMEALATTEAA